MELFTLDSNFQPYDLIENYQSLIWTERYSKYGDFQIVFNDVATGIQMLPLESFVTLRETTVPMVVEVHKIEKKKNAAPTITISGRSMETVLERRGSVKSLPIASSRPIWTVCANKPSDAAFLMMRTVLGDDNIYVSGFQVLDACFPAVSFKDAIPEISLIQPADYSLPEWRDDYTYHPGDIVGYGDYMYKSTTLADNNLNNNPSYITSGYWSVYSSQGALPPEGPVTAELYEIEPKDLYTASMELLTSNNRGLKAVRPTTSSSQVGIEIYNGANLTDTVVFDAKFDQFDEATYLLSNTGMTNVAYYYGYGGSSTVAKNSDPDAPDWVSSTEYSSGDRVNYGGVTYESTSGANQNHKPSLGSISWWIVYDPNWGLDRRILVSLNEESASGTSDPAVRRARGLIELYQNNETALFDGRVAEQVATGFNRDYFLGDIIKLNGEYGLSENVRVAEFIRSSDATGEKAYPAFEVVV